MDNKSYKNSLDITGQKFNYLLALGKTQLRQGKHVIWKFLCDCGKEHLSTATDVKRGTTKSCGCMQAKIVSRIQTTHGATKGYKPTRTYMIWRGMIKRCGNPSDKRYALYGGRGINVCKRWRDFSNFLADMGEAPLGLSIDRIDNNGNYEPLNCRWATDMEQSVNRRNTIFITIERETKCLAEWSRTSGINRGTIISRIKKGMAPSEAVFKPAAPRKKINTP